jgi:hypothetical protein
MMELMPRVCPAYELPAASEELYASRGSPMGSVRSSGEIQLRTQLYPD